MPTNEVPVWEETEDVTPLWDETQDLSVAQQPSFPRLTQQATLPEALAQPGVQIQDGLMSLQEQPDPFSAQLSPPFKPAYVPPTIAQPVPETGSTTMMGNVLGEIFAPTPTPQQRERDERMAAARQQFVIDRENQIKAAQAQADVMVPRSAAEFLDLAMAPQDPRRMEAMQRRSQEIMESKGIEPVGFMEAPRLGEPLTEQEQQLLAGKGLAGTALGAAQRTAQGFATTLVQPETFAMAPGVAGLMKPVAHVIGTSYLPGMAKDVIAQASEAAGHAWAGDWNSAIDKSVGAASTALMLSMPVMASRIEAKRRAAYQAEAEVPLEQQMDALQESLFQTAEGDPARPELQRKIADLEHRMDTLQTLEDNVVQAAEGTGRELRITDEDLGEGNIARPNRDGSISVNRRMLRLVLEHDVGRDPKKMDRVIQAIVNQEIIHSYVPNKDAEDYWNSLTDMERGLEESLYPFDPRATPAMKGQEAIRRRIEEANGLTPLENLIRTSHGPLASRSISLLIRAIRATREALTSGVGDKAKLNQQLAILNRAQERITKGLQDASSKQKTAAVHGDVRAQPVQGAGQVPVQEGGTRVQPQAQGRVAEGTQVPLNPVQTGPLKAAAYKDPNTGKVYTGAHHPEALFNAGGKKLADQYVPRESRETPDFGYVSENGTFVPRDQAGPIAEHWNQKLEQFDIDYKGDPVPHSDEIASKPGGTKPISETSKKDIRSISRNELDDLEESWNNADPQERLRMSGGDKSAIKDRWYQLPESTQNRILNFSREKTPPTAPTGEALPAAPATGEAKPGVAAPARPAVPTDKPLLSTRQELLKEIDRKEKIAQEFNGDYKGSKGGKDYYELQHDDPKVGRSQIVVPEGSDASVVRAKMKAIADAFSEDLPFAKRITREEAESAYRKYARMQEMTQEEEYIVHKLPFENLKLSQELIEKYPIELPDTPEAMQAAIELGLRNEYMVGRTLPKIRSEGARASLSKTPIADNPYIEGSPQAIAWEEGWHSQTGKGETPSAKRAIDLAKLEGEDFFKFLKSIPGGYGEKEMQKISSSIRPEDVPRLAALEVELKNKANEEYKRIKKLPKKEQEEAFRPYGDHFKMTLNSMKADRLREWLENSEVAKEMGYQPYRVPEEEAPKARRGKYYEGVSKEDMPIWQDILKSRSILIDGVPITDERVSRLAKSVIIDGFDNEMNYALARGQSGKEDVKALNLIKDAVISFSDLTPNLDIDVDAPIDVKGLQKVFDIADVRQEPGSGEPNIGQDLGPFARRGRYHEGIPQEDFWKVRNQISDGQIYIDNDVIRGKSKEDAQITFEVASQIVLYGYDHTKDMIGTSISKIEKYLRDEPDYHPETRRQILDWYKKQQKKLEELANRDITYGDEHLGGAERPPGPEPETPEAKPEPPGESAEGRPFYPEDPSQQQFPLARRGKWKGFVSKEQLELPMGAAHVLPGEEKSIAGVPVERKTPEEMLGKAPPAIAILAKSEQMARAPIEFGTRKSRHGEKHAPEVTKKYPKLQDFIDWVRNNVGPNVGISHITDMWRDAVNQDMVHATPERLADWVKVYDLGKKLGLRYSEEGGIDPASIPAEPGKEVFTLEPLREGEKPKAKKKKVEGAETVYRAGKKQVGTEEKRAAIISAVLRERLRETEPKKNLDTKELEIENLDLGNNDTVVGVVRKVNLDEANNLDSLGNLLRDEARTKGEPLSHTRRLAVIVDRLNPNNRRVEAVSTYHEGGKQMIVDPTKHGITDRPNVELDANFIRRYRVIGSLLLSHPVRNFRKTYSTIGEYVAKIEKPGLELERPRESIPGEDPGSAVSIKDLKEDEYDYWRRELMGVAERQEARGDEPRGATPGLKGEGGFVTGPGAAEVRSAIDIATGELQRAQNKPLTASELNSTIDWIIDEVGDVKSPTDVFRAFEMLKERARLDMLDQQRRQQIERQQGSQKHLKELEEIQKLRNPEKLSNQQKSLLKELERRKWRELMSRPNPDLWLKGRPRQVISAIQKIAKRIYDKSYDEETQDYFETPDTAYGKALIEIADNIIDRTDLQGFIQKTLSKYGPGPEDTGAVPGVAVTAPRAEGVTRELTAPEVKRTRLGGPQLLRTGKPPTKYPLPRTEPELAPTIPEKLQGPVYQPPPAEPLPGGITGLEGGKIPGQEPGGKPPKPYIPTEGPIVEPGPFKLPVSSGEGARTRLVTKRPAFVMRPKTEARFELEREGEPAKEAPKPILGPEVRMELPAAKRPSALKEEINRASKALTDAVKRQTVLRDIPRTLDGIENIGVIQSHEVVNSIRLASSDPSLKGKAQEQMATKLREAAIAVQSTIEKPDPKEAEKARKYAEKYGLELFPEEDPKPNPANVNKLINMAELGIQRANKLIESKNPADQWVGRRYLKAARKLRDAAEFARDNWSNPALHETVDAVKRELKGQLDREHEAGMDTQEWFNYLPGLYEGEIYNKGLLNFGAWNILGRNYRQAKKFTNYYQAIAEGPFLPASYDIADIVGHRVRRGNYVIARRAWQTTLKGMRDPVTKQTIAKEPSLYSRDRPTIDPDTGEQKVNEETGEKEFHKEVGYVSPDNQHVLIDPVSGEKKDIFVGTKPLAIRKGYEDMITACLSRSSVRKYAGGRLALQATSALKHGWVLMLDSFHLGRLEQFAVASTPNWFRKITGREAPGFGAGYRGGYTALAYRPEDIQLAVDKGVVSQHSANWAMEPITVNIGKGRTAQMTRHQVVREMVHNGLNAGRVADAIYKDVVKDIPIIGHYNKWLFDHFVPGLIAETAVRNFEAANASHPEVQVHKLMRDIIRDTNATYGNMGRQGTFRDATLRDMLQLLLLAPSWREGLFQKDIRYMSRLAQTAEHGGRVALNKLGANLDPYKGVTQKLVGREGLPPMGSLGGMMTRGLASYFVLGQVINLISSYARTGKPQFTWQNQEEGRKLDAFLPLGKNGVWVPTLGVFGEVTGDVIRYGETKGTAYEQLLQVGINSLGPAGRAANVLWTRETPRGEKLTSSAGILKASASEMFPAPISLSTGMRGAGHMIAPGMVAPNEPGTVPQRVLGSMGMKVHRGIDPETHIHRMAAEWAREKGIPESPIDITIKDIDSISKLRHALKIGDEGGAKRIYANLVDRYDKTPRGKGYEKYSSEDMILNAMKIWRDRPFTGNLEKEDEFRSSLTGAAAEAYNRADEQRMNEYTKIVEFIGRQPMK